MSKKRKHSATSKAAYDSMKGRPIQDHHKKIITAYHAIGQGHYEDIWIHVGFKDKNQVARRHSELERMGVIEKTGKKKLTSSKRNAFVYRLTRAGFNTAMGLQQKSLFPEEKEKP